jgi:hypothetical protein
MAEPILLREDKQRVEQGDLGGLTPLKRAFDPL